MDKTSKIIKEMFEVQRNDLYAERIVSIGSNKLRAQIKRNHYDFQSYARVSAWTFEKGWQVITTEPFAKMKVRNFMPPTCPAHCEKTEWKAAAKKDLDLLIDVGVDIIL